MRRPSSGSSVGPVGPSEHLVTLPDLSQRFLVRTGPFWGHWRRYRATRPGTAPRRGRGGRCGLGTTDAGGWYYTAVMGDQVAQRQLCPGCAEAVAG